jgi:hypothetical protein
LQTRKRLLLLESEVHRQQLAQDWTDMKGCFYQLEEKARPVAKVASIAGLIMAGLSGFNQLRHSKGSLFSRLLSGGFLSTLMKFAGNLGAR